MKNQARMIFINGSVITVDKDDRICEAVAIDGNRIIGVGSSRGIKTFAGPETLIVDLGGRSLLPGFVDAHCHAGIYGTIRFQIPCGSKDAQSIKEIKQAVALRAASTPPGGWILGRGYNHLTLKERRHPTRWDLDEVAPGHKVFLTRTCGHIAVANSRVLNEFGIDRHTPDPEGGRIERDSQGEPTGLLYEQAMLQIRMQTLPSADDLTKGMKLMNRDFLSLGITSVHDASGLNPEEIRIFQRGVTGGWIQVRLYLMFRSSGPSNQLGEIYLKSGILTGFGNEKLRLGPYKLMLDGAGSGGSAGMRVPYPHKPSDYGILYMNQDELDRKVLKAHQACYQVAIHAIGDQAIEMALLSFEKALKQHPRKDHRHRIEHCGFLDDSLIDKIHELDVIPVLGLPFLYELGDTYIEIYGQDRLKRVYPLRSLVDRGIKTALSSDAPVIEPNPMHGIYAAITHRTKTGKMIAPEERVNILQAIRAYTFLGAYASFEEDIKGSIEVGKLADLIVLSRNILECPQEDIPKTSVDLTMVDGVVVYQNERR
jgi:predicted amidohydrolase YtcJ